MSSRMKFREALLRFNSGVGFTKNHAREVVEKRNDLCRLLGISNLDSGRRWFANGEPPKGICFLRLSLVLEWYGLEIEEREVVGPAAKLLGSYIALGIVTVEEVVQVVGAANNDAIVGVATGVRGWSDERRGKAEALLNSKDSEFRAKMSEFTERLNQIFSGRTISTPTPEVSISAPAPVDSSAALTSAVVEVAGEKIRQDTVRLLAYHIKAISPLVDAVVSDVFTPEDRMELRKLTLTPNQRSNMVFDLLAKLKKLCSEDARNGLQSATSKRD